VDGDPVIGKTTLWSAVVKQAVERGFRVLTARPAAAESVLAYASLADLLADVDAAAFVDLPYPQRRAIDRVLLRADADGEPTDQRAVAAGFLSIVQRLGEQSPVLLAIDDLQWLDESSVRVLAFAARRLAVPVGVLGAVRTDPDGARAASWLQLSQVDTVERITLCPLTLGALHVVISERLGRSFPRPTMVRIHQISGGNPFYGLELARAIAGGATDVNGSLPSTLAGLVRAHIGSLDAELRAALLAAACLAEPTISLVSKAIDTDADRLVDILAVAEEEAIIGIEGDRLRFTHPLMAAGVYTEAKPGQRRKQGCAGKRGPRIGCFPTFLRFRTDAIGRTSVLRSRPGHSQLPQGLIHLALTHNRSLSRPSTSRSSTAAVVLISAGRVTSTGCHCEPIAAVDTAAIHE
jgi:hypothetical protein